MATTAAPDSPVPHSPDDPAPGSPDGHLAGADLSAADLSGAGVASAEPTPAGPPDAGPPPAAGAPGPTYMVPAFLVLSVVWGSSFLFIKIGVRELHPLYVTLGRVIFGGAVILLAVLVMRARLPRDLRTWGHLLVLGTVGVAIPFTLFGFGEQRIPSLLAGIWNATTPLVALPMAVLLFRVERFTTRKVVGIGLGFVGVLVVLGIWQVGSGGSLAGQLLCLGAACCYGFAIPYLKRFLADEPISGLALVAGQMIAACAVLLVVAPLVAGAPPAPTELSGEVVGSIMALGVFGTGLAFVLHMRNIRLLGATASSLVTYLIPLVAVLAGVLLLGESLTWFQPVGALIVLGGIAVSQGLPSFGRRVRAQPRAPAGEGS